MLDASNFKNGYFHLHVKDGEIQNGFSHLTLPEGEYVLYMKVDAVYSPDGFIESHSIDADERKMDADGIVYNLADNSVVFRTGHRTTKEYRR